MSRQPPIGEPELQDAVAGRRPDRAPHGPLPDIPERERDFWRRAVAEERRRLSDPPHALLRRAAALVH